MDYLKKIQEWFLTYPLLDKNGKIYANLMEKTSVNYAIVENPTPRNGTVRNFAGGDSIVQFVFDFDTRYVHGTANTPKTNNWNNSKSYQDLIEWVKLQNRVGNLPEVDGIQAIEVISSPFVKQVAPDGNTAVHSMTLRILVYKTFNYFEYIQTLQKENEK